MGCASSQPAVDEAGGPAAVVRQQQPEAVGVAADSTKDKAAAANSPLPVPAPLHASPPAAAGQLPAQIAASPHKRIDVASTNSPAPASGTLGSSTNGTIPAGHGSNGSGESTAASLPAIIQPATAPASSIQLASQADSIAGPNSSSKLSKNSLAKNSQSVTDGPAHSPRLTRRPSDEDSNWDDQCTAYDLEKEGEQAPPLPEPEPVAAAAGPAMASLMEKVHSTSLHAEKPPEQEQAAEYKETSTMRVEKFKGCMFVNQYLVVKFLGRGACGKVFLCLNTNDLRLYAMKAVRKVDVEATQPPPGSGAKPKRNPMEDLKREILIMKQMKHPNIVMLSEVIDDPAGSKLLLVMEFMEGGPVLTREALEKREKLPEMLALQYFRDMVKSLDYLHCNKVVHGDLKPENVLMSATGEVKLSDFGCSKIFATGNEYLERCNGTPAFLAPEMMKPNTRFRGRPTDIYALGACLYTLVFGRIPFSAPNLYKLFQVVQNEPVRFPSDVIVTDALKHLLNAMLAKNPRDRISLQDIMRHPWVTMSGNFPLKSTKDLRGDETQERHMALVGGRTFAECHPCPDYLSGLALLSQHERVFKEGDYIMRQGDPGSFLLFIMSGTVDVLVHWSKPRHSSIAHSGGVPPSGQGRSNAGGGDEFGDNGEELTPVADPESLQHRLNLARAAAKARDFVDSLQQAAGSPNELLVAQRGPGELVGEMALFTKTQARCEYMLVLDLADVIAADTFYSATVRCNTPVTARIITHEQLAEYLADQPMAKHQVREGIWKKESEITIVEALVKLANAHDIIATSLSMAGVAVGSGAYM